MSAPGNKTQFIKPDEVNPVQLSYPIDYQKKVAAYKASYLKLEPNIWENVRSRHWTNKSLAKPENIHTFLTQVMRVRIPEGSFEDPDTGEIIRGPNAPAEAICYTLWEYIDDEDSLKMGNPTFTNPLSTDTWTVGRYDRPKTRLKKETRGNVVDSEVIGNYYCYYIKYSADNLRAVIENPEYKHHKNFSMVVSENGGYNKRTIFNKKEFVEGDLSDLVAANIGDNTGKSFLTKDRAFGGLNRYLLDKEEKRKVGLNKDETIIDSITSSNNNRKTTTKKSISKIDIDAS
jgi:hypothetical protein